MDPVDIVVLKTCPMDRDGWFNLSAANVWHRAIVERAKMVVVETTRGLPYVFGVDNGLHVSEVDYIIEGDDDLAPELPNPPPTDIDRAVARHIAAEVEDGACLQIGIGGNAQRGMRGFCSSRKRGARSWRAYGDDDRRLGRPLQGRAHQRRPQEGASIPARSSTTFALGLSDLYATLDRNPDMLCCPVDYTNMPHVIMQNDKAVSINNTTQVDLKGQAASESDGHRHISGTGGQLQFVRGAYASKGGKSFMCMSSTYDKRGEPRSRIVLDLTPGNVVTTPRSDVMYVVTEYGMVNLKGKSVAERAQSLIAIAHPDFREGPRWIRQAYEHHLIPRGV